LEGKTAVFVGVEELDQAVGLTLGDGEVAVVAQVVEHLEGGDKRVTVAVKSLKGRMGRKVPNRTQSLSGGFKSALSVTNSNKEVLEASLRFVTKHILDKLSKQKAKGRGTKVSLLDYRGERKNQKMKFVSFGFQNKF